MPTEVDYAFFKDRAAHTSPALERIRVAIANLLNTEPGAARWKIRRAIALNVRPTAQITDRLGRDVAFYIDGSGISGLLDEERQAWTNRGRLRASDAGLLDLRNYSVFAPTPSISTEISNPAALNERERAACPAAVLETRRPAH